MKRERMTTAEYRELIAAEKPKSRGSARGEQGTAVGTCRVCGGHVKATDEAWFHVDVHADGSEERWVEHQKCHPNRVRRAGA